MHATIEIEDKDFDKLVQFVGTEALQIELRRRLGLVDVVVNVKSQAKGQSVTAATPQTGKQALASDAEQPELKRRPGRPRLVKEEVKTEAEIETIDFEAEEAKVEKIHTREDVVTALNTYATNGGGLAAGKAKIKAFCGSEKLADIPVDRYAEFIESLGQANE